MFPGGGELRGVRVDEAAQGFCLQCQLLQFREAVRGPFSLPLAAAFLNQPQTDDVFQVVDLAIGPTFVLESARVRLSLVRMGRPAHSPAGSRCRRTKGRPRLRRGQRRNGALGVFRRCNDLGTLVFPHHRAAGHHRGKQAFGNRKGISRTVLPNARCGHPASGWWRRWSFRRPGSRTEHRQTGRA